MGRNRSRARQSRWRAWGDRVASLALTVLAGAAVLAIVTFLFILEMDVPGAQVRLQGTITGWSQRQSEYSGGPTAVFVQLDDGGAVKATASEHAVLRVGKRVVVFKETSRILGRTTYRFGGYLEEPQPLFK